LRHSWRVLALLRRVATHAAEAAGFTVGSLSIAVVGGRAMATLHKRHLGIEGPTDVLTFDFGCNRCDGLLDAEIIVCADVARSRRLQNADAKAELALYIVHGLLHLAGYTDHTVAAARKMHAREDEILSDFGLGPVFREGQ